MVVVYEVTFMSWKKMALARIVLEAMVRFVHVEDLAVLFAHVWLVKENRAPAAKSVFLEG